MGPFEEEEKGTGVASDVFKVQGEDPAIPGPLKKNDPGTVTIPQYRVNKTKQHTLNCILQNAIAFLAKPQLSGLIQR